MADHHVLRADLDASPQLTGAARLSVPHRPAGLFGIATGPDGGLRFTGASRLGRVTPGGAIGIYLTQSNAHPLGGPPAWPAAATGRCGSLTPRIRSGGSPSRSPLRSPGSPRAPGTRDNPCWHRGQCRAVWLTRPERRAGGCMRHASVSTRPNDYYLGGLAWSSAATNKLTSISLEWLDGRLPFVTYQPGDRPGERVPADITVARRGERWPCVISVQAA
jgi:hypothetical protein